MNTDGIKELLYRNAEHPRWDDVAGRCLACTNCTLACPTCFCFSVDDVTDLAGEQAERVQRWDSCFTMDDQLFARRQRARVNQVPVPAVADPQARELDRRVRNVRMRRVRPMHHLVPRGNRHHPRVAAIRASDEG